MYDFNYNFVKKQTSFSSRILFTDTDLLCYFCEGPVDSVVKKNKNLFDLSNYEDTNLFDTSNKKILGKFKNDSPNTPLIESVRFTIKMYSILTAENDSEKSKRSKKRSRRKRNNTLTTKTDYFHKQISGIRWISFVLNLIISIHLNYQKIRYHRTTINDGYMKTVFIRGHTVIGRLPIMKYSHLETSIIHRECSD